MPLPLLMHHCPYFPWSLHRSPWRLLPPLFPNPRTLDSQRYRQLQYWPVVLASVPGLGCQSLKGSHANGGYRSCWYCLPAVTWEEP